MAVWRNLVIVPADTDLTNISAQCGAISIALHFCDARRKFPSYKKLCSCRESVGRDATQKFKKPLINKAQELFNAEISKLRIKYPDWQESELYIAEKEKIKELLTNDLYKQTNDFLKTQTDLSPSPNCGMCKGTGSYSSTDNPKGVWKSWAREDLGIWMRSVDDDENKYKEGATVEEMLSFPVHRWLGYSYVCNKEYHQKGQKFLGMEIDKSDEDWGSEVIEAMNKVRDLKVVCLQMSDDHSLSL